MMRRKLIPLAIGLSLLGFISPRSEAGSCVGVGYSCDANTPCCAGTNCDANTGVCDKACALPGESATLFPFGCCEGGIPDPMGSGLCVVACAQMGQDCNLYSYGCCSGASCDTKSNTCQKACALPGEAAGSGTCCSGGAPDSNGVCQLACAQIDAPASSQPGGCCSGGAQGSDGLCHLVCASVGAPAASQPGGCCAGTVPDVTGICQVACALQGAACNSQPGGCCSGGACDTNSNICKPACADSGALCNSAPAGCCSGYCNSGTCSSCPSGDVIDPATNNCAVCYNGANSDCVDAQGDHAAESCQAGGCVSTKVSLTANTWIVPGPPYYQGETITVWATGGPPLVQVDLSGDATCHESITGSCSASVTLGKAAPSTYNFTVTVSSPGASSVTVSTSAVLSPFNITASADPLVEPPGQSSGTLSVSLSGGVAPFTYAWSIIGGLPGAALKNPISPSTVFTLTPAAWGNYAFQIVVKDSLGQTSKATITVSYPQTPASTITLGTPSNNSVWMASASTGTGQVDFVATVDPILPGWAVSEVDYQIPCGSAGGIMPLIPGFPDKYAPAKTVYVAPGLYSACVTATTSDGQGHTITDTIPSRSVAVFLQPTATITGAGVYSATAPVVVTVGSQYDKTTYPGQTVGAVAIYADGTPMNNAPKSSAAFSFSLSTGPHHLEGFAFDGTVEPGSNPPQTSQFASAAAPLDILIVPTFNPSIVFTTPAFGTRVLAGTSVNMAVNASAAETRTLQKVDFFIEGIGLIGEVAKPPYQTAWKSIFGTWQLSAGATDNTGLANGTPLLTVNVDSPPVVSIMSPPTNSVLLSGSSTTVTFNAFDPNANGSIAEVDLYVDNVYVDSATWVGSSSYTYVWTPGGSGTHFLKALATDWYSWTTTTAQTLVQISTGGAIAPFITQQPSSTTVSAGQSATFSIGAVGVPSPSYQWQVNTGAGFANIANATNASYSTPPVALTSSGWQYQCIVSNKAGTLTSIVVNLTVKPPPKLSLAMLAAGPVAIGQTATFQITASAGVAPYTYQWQTAPPGSSTWTVASNAAGTSFAVTASSFAQNGMQVRGQVTDSQPGAPQTAFSATGLLSIPHLTLVSSPISLIIVTPNIAGFTTLVNFGMPPYHYRWQRSVSAGGTAFADIADAADSAYYSFTATDATYNKFAFQCIVTDTNGDSVTTVPSVLTIIVPKAADDSQMDDFLSIPPLAAGTNNYGSVVQFRNIGFNAWTSTGGYVLAVQNPSNNMTWGYQKVSLLPGEIVLPGGTRDFLLSVPAPSAAGSYPFYWQMQHNGQFFGPVAGQQVAVVSLAAIPNVLPSNGEISLPLGTSGSVNFSVFGNVPGTNTASVAGAPHAGALGAPMATMTLPAGQTLDLNSLHLSPGDYILQVIMTDANGLQSPPVSKALTIVQPGVNSIRIYPDPWRSDQDTGNPLTFDMMTAGSQLKIFTVSGRWVQTLTADANGTSRWDLRNSAGELVQSGIYLYLVADGQGGKAHGKFAVIR